MTKIQNQQLSEIKNTVIYFFKKHNWSKSTCSKYIKIFETFKPKHLEQRLKRLYKLRNNHGVTKYRLLLLYGKEECQKRWKHYCDKQAETNTFEYKHKKYGMTREEFKKYNKSRAITKENMIKKYGKTKGLEFFNNYCKKQSYTNSMEYFKEKYGEIEGELKYFTALYSKTKFFSNISQVLFKEIDEQIPEECFYATHNGEIRIFNDELNKDTYFDFAIPSLKILIEFNGDLFHANPSIFKESDTPNPFNKKVTAKEIWNYDNIKNKFAFKQHYDIIIIWENEYRKNPKKVLNNILKQIKNKRSKIETCR